MRSSTDGPAARKSVTTSLMVCSGATAIRFRSTTCVLILPPLPRFSVSLLQLTEENRSLAQPRLQTLDAPPSQRRVKRRLTAGSANLGVAPTATCTHKYTSLVLTLQFLPPCSAHHYAKFDKSS